MCKKGTKMFVKRILILAMVIMPAIFAGAQDEIITMQPFQSSARHWYGIKDAHNVINFLPEKPKYGLTEITNIADNILLFQRNNGGWPKNYDMQAILTTEQKDSLLKVKNDTHTTFDNSTTFTHIDYLAKVYVRTGIEEYKIACLKGIHFILSAQYANGGWPQYYPLEDNYSRRITFNDGAFAGIMYLLKKIGEDEELYNFVNPVLKKKVNQAFNKGLECILETQIKLKNNLTVWGQQYDEISLEPAWARAYEPPSICNSESAPVVLLLMSLERKDPEVIAAVESAVEWFRESKIMNTRVEWFNAPVLNTKWRTISKDRRVVIDENAPPIWTRYYELETGRPLFSDRNSEFLYSMAEVSRERRCGYGWYTYAPQDVINKYPEWKHKMAKL